MILANYKQSSHQVWIYDWFAWFKILISRCIMNKMLNCHPFMTDQVAPRPMVLSLTILPGGLLERCQAYSVEVADVQFFSGFRGWRWRFCQKDLIQSRFSHDVDEVVKSSVYTRRINTIWIRFGEKSFTGWRYWRHQRCNLPRQSCCNLYSEELSYDCPGPFLEKEQQTQFSSLSPGFGKPTYHRSQLEGLGSGCTGCAALSRNTLETLEVQAKDFNRKSVAITFFIFPLRLKTPFLVDGSTPPRNVWKNSETFILGSIFLYHHVIYHQRQS